VGGEGTTRWAGSARFCSTICAKKGVFERDWMEPA
jgi:hypothetical protein